MKRVILLLLAIGILSHSAAFAQERGPLVMRVEFEWTLVGIIAGSAFGVLVWLTDPADPSNNLSDSIANGAAWGALLGAGFGIFVLQETAISPGQAAIFNDPLHPRNRITSDPVAIESGNYSLLAHQKLSPGGKNGIVLPLVNLRF